MFRNRGTRFDFSMLHILDRISIAWRVLRGRPFMLWNLDITDESRGSHLVDDVTSAKSLKIAA